MVSAPLLPMCQGNLCTRVISFLCSILVFKILPDYLQPNDLWMEAQPNDLLMEAFVLSLEWASNSRHPSTMLTLPRLKTEQQIPLWWWKASNNTLEMAPWEFFLCRWCRPGIVAFTPSPFLVCTGAWLVQKGHWLGYSYLPVIPSCWNDQPGLWAASARWSSLQAALHPVADWLGVWQSKDWNEARVTSHHLPPVLYKGWTGTWWLESLLFCFRKNKTADLNPTIWLQNYLWQMYNWKTPLKWSQ